MGSLTLSSLNFSDNESINTPEMIKKLINKMNETNIKPELEVFDNGMINASKYYIKKGLLKPPFYYNLMIGNLYTCQDSLNDISSMINNLPPNSIFSLGGIGNCQKRVNYLGLLYADGVRVGLEDFIYEDEHRTQLISNFDLVKRLVDFCNNNNFNILNAKEVRSILKIQSE
jgi:3-keto-5-aminohexanoate cleavage enzyme